MERKDQRDPYREQRSESRREMGAQNQDYRGQDLSERRQYGEMERSQGRQFEWDRDQWDVDRGRAITEGGRQYEQPGGGYGYGRRDYTAGQAGQGYYGARPMGDWASTGYGYGAGSYASSPPDYAYGTQDYRRSMRPMAGRTYVGYGWREMLSQYSELRTRKYFRFDEHLCYDV